MREKFLIRLAHWHTHYPWRILPVVIIATIALGWFAQQLTITMRTQDLMPEGDPKVDEFNRIIDEFATATSIIVVVQGEEQRIKDFADDLAPRVSELRDSSQNEAFEEAIAGLQKRITDLEKSGNKTSEINSLQDEIERLQKRIDMQLFQRVDYKVETDFLQKHALMLVKAEDLKNTKDVFMDPNLTGLLTNLNNSLEKEYVGQQESISTREKEDQAVGFLDGIQQLLQTLQKAANGSPLSEMEVQTAADKFLLGEPYFLSYDKSALILNVIPNFSIMDRDLIMTGYEHMQLLLDETLENHPEVRAGLSGDIAREHDEQVHSEESLSFTTVIALIAILVMLVVAFRMWVAPILAIVTLFVGLIWAFGTAYLAVGQLNMMTALFSVLLLGLGIDFAVHLISGFTEWRAAGDGIGDSLEKTFLKSGKGIITGALTTIFAFSALLISQSRGMKEMGIVTGFGLFSILLATLLFLPVMLVLRERWVERRRKKKAGGQPVVAKDISFKNLGRWAEWLGKHYRVTLAGAAIVSAFLIWSALQIEYDRNYLRMEPKGLQSIALMDTIKEKFDLSMEYALCLANDAETSRRLSEEYRDLSTVARTADISIYLPSANEQQERAVHIADIRKRMSSTGIRQSIRRREFPILIQEIERLEMNIIEMQDMAYFGGQDKVDNKCKSIVGDPDAPKSANMIGDLLASLTFDRAKTIRRLSEFQQHFSPYFRQSVIDMCSTEPITLADLPVSALDRYSNPERDKFMITIYPESQLAINSIALNRFVDDIERVSEKTTGGPPVIKAWLQIAARDGRNAMMLTLVIVFFLLWGDLKKPGYALMAMIPLALGAFWMVGIWQWVGLLLNFMTLMGLPLIIGIGIDDGVHIMHRWQNEGRGQIKTIFASTGKAISLTSLTTMLAFGSLMFSVFPAWAWFGSSLVIGVGACFLTTVIVLPGILGMLERKTGQDNELITDEIHRPRIIERV